MRFYIVFIVMDIDILHVYSIKICEFVGVAM